MNVMQSAIIAGIQIITPMAKASRMITSNKAVHSVNNAGRCGI